jgi:hypothetical protein
MSRDTAPARRNEVPETRAQRIERLTNTPNRTPRQDQLLTAEKDYMAAAARTDALDHQHRTQN